MRLRCSGPFCLCDLGSYFIWASRPLHVWQLLLPNRHPVSVFVGLLVMEMVSPRRACFWSLPSTALRLYLSNWCGVPIQWWVTPLGGTGHLVYSGFDRTSNYCKLFFIIFSFTWVFNPRSVLAIQLFSLLLSYLPLHLTLQFSSSHYLSPISLLIYTYI